MKASTLTQAALLAVLVTATPVLAAQQSANQGQGQGQGQTSGQSASKEAQQLKYSNLVPVDRLEGRAVYSSDNQRLGDVDQVLFNPQSGQVEMLVLGRGGFLEMGETRHAIPWKAFRLTDQGLRLNIEQAKLATAPVYNEDQLQALSRPDNMQRLYSFYGVTPPESGSAMGGTSGAGQKTMDQQSK